MANWFITGVSSGLGRALADAVLARGDTVCGTVRRAEAGAAFAALAPGRAHAIPLDLMDTDAIAPAVAAAQAAMGPIDVLVNNAGQGMAGAIEETGLDQVRALFEVNLVAAIATIQAVLPEMRARRAGTIVNIGSVSGLAPWSGTGVYGATKYALHSIGLTLADEVRPLGIRVVTIAPGGMRTGFGGPALAEAEREIDDYAGGAHRAKAILRRGEHRGDPALAARAILTALDDPDPPRVLLLGEDALHYAEDEIAGLAAEFARWRPLTLAIGSDA